ncbi:hypothetical protein [Photobacterium leiognathi]|uniref:hypothetical protein n=1 Tax=Photobacterium leiognathi TaxID=553611 RepID=UPI002980C82D|nr:hypothetical protein [Photobacterium leiognathi]
MEKNKLSELIILLIIPIIALFDVNMFISKITVWVCISLFIFSLFFLKIKLNVKIISFLLIFFTVIICSSLVSAYTFYDFDFKIIIRCSKIIVLCIYMVISYYMLLETDNKTILNYLKIIYYFSLVHVIFLLWQLISYKFGFYFPNVGLTTIHGVSETISNIIGERLTGIANEPSYMARMLIQILLLSLFFKNYTIALVSICLGFLTFSMSYFVTLFILMLSLIVTKGYFRIIFVFFVLALIVYMIEPYLFTFIFERFSTESSGESARSHDLIRAPLLFFDNCNYLTCLIGFGQDSIPRLNVDNVLIYDTTNNYYIDSLIENGILYSLLFFSFIISVYLRVKKYSWALSFFILALLGIMFRNDVLTFGFSSVILLAMMMSKLECKQR